MRQIFVISDTHFGHENILTFFNNDGSRVRNFSCVEEMDEHMVEQWNKVVSDSDIVYHLGDVFFGKGHQHLSRLKGRKRLVLGNHDNAKSEHLLKNFQKIMVWRLFPDLNCLLSHVPIHKESFRKVDYNLHGHVHGNSYEDKSYLNCCVEALDFTPTPIEEVMKRNEVVNG
jgi:calcineurin-like phosphoesterase family protein